MESQFFDWAGWDQLDLMTFAFYDCVLTHPIGKFKTGSEFDQIVMAYDHGKVELHRGDEIVATYELVLRVGPEK